MVTTQIRRGARIPPYLKQHRKAAGVTAIQMAGRLDVERESVYRYERDPMKMSLGRLQQWAEACGLQSWRELLVMPERRSVDQIIDDLPDDLQDAVADLAMKMASQRR